MDCCGDCPGRRDIRADAIEQVVTLELRRMAEMLRNDEDTLRPAPVKA